MRPKSMNQHEFETAVMRMWSTTRIPLTRANILVFTGAPRDRSEKWMNELVLAGLVELDSDDEGEALWRVRGATRSTAGARSIDEWTRFDKLNREVSSESPRARQSRNAPVRLESRLAEAEPVRDEKSLVASGLLSLVFGPLGWLYAAPLKDALPAILATIVVINLLPMTIAASVMGLLNPLAAAAGVVYAWRYNKTGRRSSLLELVRGDDAPRLPRGRE